MPVWDPHGARQRPREPQFHLPSSDTSAGADRRACALHPTPAGRGLLERALAAAFAYEQDLCADLTAAEREQLLELLGHVAARLDLPPGGHPTLAEE